MQHARHNMPQRTIAACSCSTTWTGQLPECPDTRFYDVSWLTNKIQYCSSSQLFTDSLSDQSLQCHDAPAGTTSWPRVPSAWPPGHDCKQQQQCEHMNPGESPSVWFCAQSISVQCTDPSKVESHSSEESFDPSFELLSASRQQKVC